MAAPTITFKGNTGTNGSPTWTTIGGSDTITFTGAGSSDGDLKPIPRPLSTGIRIADELWINTGTDTEVSGYDGGGQETDSYSVDMFASDPVAGNVIAIEISTNDETQAGELEAWDNGSYNSTANEILSAAGLGITGHSQIRAAETASNIVIGQTTSTVPSGYENQFANSTTWQLQGDTRSITFTAACASALPKHNRVVFHNFVMDDSTAGSDTCELTYKYYYT